MEKPRSQHPRELQERLSTEAARAFDAVAASYDVEFEENPVTANLRKRIWASVFNHFLPGDHVLELNSGTGTDAIAMAHKGINVTVTDASPAMIERAEEKASMANVSSFLTFRRLPFEEITPLSFPASSFDGIFSNFGGLNCTKDLPALFRILSPTLKPEKYAIFCFINKNCLWEMASYVVRGNLSAANRRRSGGAIQAHVGSSMSSVWYYSPAEIAVLLAPWFTVQEIYGLSILSPPPNSRSFIQKYPTVTNALMRLEQDICHLLPFRNLGDHFVIIARRKRETVS